MRKLIIALASVVLIIACMITVALAAEKLSMPTNLHWDGKIACWDGVPNATGYSLNLELVEGDNTHSYALYSYEDHYDCTEEIGFLSAHTSHISGSYTYRFSVRSSSDDYDFYTSSDWTDYSPIYTLEITSREKLSKPQNLTWDGMVAKWNKVPNATGYSVNVELVRDDNSTHSYAGSSNTNSFDCTSRIKFLASQTGLSDGTVTIRYSVSAYTDDYEHYVGGDTSDYSPLYYYHIPARTKLSTPSNLHWDGMVARWNPVSNAEGYSLNLELVKGDQTHSYALYSYSNSLDCSKEMKFLASSQDDTDAAVLIYRFHIAATPNDSDQYISSDWSEYSPTQACMYGYKNLGLTPVTEALSFAVLPSNLKAIGDEAFANADFEAIIIPEGCTTIGDHAFYENRHLLYVKLPGSISEISDDAFDGCDNVYIDR